MGRKKEKKVNNPTKIEEIDEIEESFNNQIKSR